MSTLIRTLVCALTFATAAEAKEEKTPAQGIDEVIASEVMDAALDRLEAESAAETRARIEWELELFAEIAAGLEPIWRGAAKATGFDLDGLVKAADEAAKAGDHATMDDLGALFGPTLREMTETVDEALGPAREEIAAVIETAPHGGIAFGDFGVSVLVDEEPEPPVEVAPPQPADETLIVPRPFPIVRVSSGNRRTAGDSNGVISAGADVSGAAVSHGTASVGGRFRIPADVTSVHITTPYLLLRPWAAAVALFGVSSAEVWAGLHVVDERGNELCSVRRSLYHARAIGVGLEESPFAYVVWWQPSCEITRVPGAESTYTAIVQVEAWTAAHGGGVAKASVLTDVYQLQATLRR